MALSLKTPSLYQVGKWCPGCGHGIFNRLVQEVLEEKGLLENNVCIVGVGCSSNIHQAIRGGNKVECHHGRATSAGNGMKRLMPDTCIWTYQGDGDAYAIGMGETILAAASGYPITVFVVNNCNYGMTGGQSAPTTLHGQKTTTAPLGYAGTPFNAVPVLCTMEHVSYVARGTTASAQEIRKLKKYISTAIDKQMNEGKYAFVEVLCQCPTNWHKTPLEASHWIMETVIKDFPLGEFKK